MTVVDTRGLQRVRGKRKYFKPARQTQAAIERAKYRRGELVQTKEMMLESPDRRVSGDFYPELAAQLPEPTLLLDRDKVKE